MEKIKNYKDFLKESHPSEYKAPKGSARDKKLNKAQELLKGSEAYKKKAYKLRDEMEEKEREKTNESLINEAKKSKKKTLEQIVKERTEKRNEEEQKSLDEQAKIKKDELKKIETLRADEKTGVDFELNLLSDEFNNFAEINITDSNKKDSSETDDRTLDYDFM